MKIKALDEKMKTESSGAWAGRKLAHQGKEIRAKLDAIETPKTEAAEPEVAPAQKSITAPKAEKKVTVTESYLA